MAVGLCLVWDAPSAEADGDCTDGCLQVRVEGAGGDLSTRTLSARQVGGAQDRGAYSVYTLRRDDGSIDSSDRATAPNGSTSALALLNYLGIAPDQVDSLAVSSSGRSGPVVLTNAQRDFESPGPYADGPHRNGPPVFSAVGTDGGTIRFLRAPRDEADKNARDFIDANIVTVDIKTSGRVLDLKVTPTRTTTTTEDENGIGFTVTTADGGDVPQGSTVSWDFQDGTDPPDEATVQHRWTAAGPKTVRATVQTDGGDGGTATAQVEVTGPEQNPSSGPPGAGGGTDDGPRTGSPGDGGQVGGTTGKGGLGKGGPGTRGTAKSGRSGAGTGGATDTSTSPGSATDSAKAAQQAQAEQRGRSKASPRAADGATVSGVLLDADAARSVTVVSGSSPKVASVTPRKTTDLPRDWRWLLAGIPVALILLGSVRQTPWWSRRRPELPWRT